MISVATGYIIGIGCACLISSIYFYYTQRDIRCYYEEDVPIVNSTLHV